MPFPNVSIIGSLKPKTTDLKAKQIGANWSEKIRTQSAFSARTTEQSYVDELKRRLMSVAGGEETPQVAQRKLRATLAKIGYTPEEGFPNAKGVAVGAKGSITDLSSEARLRLIMKTNVQQARSMGQMSASQSPIFKMTEPAWRLTRTGWRREPRGDWKQRWNAAGNAVNWQGACRKEFVALKDSPIWAALGSGAGGFKDTLHEAYPPFAYGSGMAWVHCSRKEAIALGLDVVSADPTTEEVSDYLAKRDKGEIDPRDLPKQLPQRYQDKAQEKSAKQKASASAMFVFNRNALVQAQQSITLALEALRDAYKRLDSAKGRFVAAIDKLGSSKSASVIASITEGRIELIKKTLVSSRMGIDTLSTRLSMLALPTTASEQSEYDSNCATIRDAARLYSNNIAALKITNIPDELESAAKIVERENEKRNREQKKVDISVKGENEAQTKQRETLRDMIVDAGINKKVARSVARELATDVARVSNKVSIKTLKQNENDAYCIETEKGIEIYVNPNSQNEFGNKYSIKHELGHAWWADIKHTLPQKDFEKIESSLKEAMELDKANIKKLLNDKLGDQGMAFIERWILDGNQILERRASKALYGKEISLDDNISFEDRATLSKIYDTISGVFGENYGKGHDDFYMSDEECRIHEVIANCSAVYRNKKFAELFSNTVKWFRNINGEKQ